MHDSYIMNSVLVTLSNADEIYDVFPDAYVKSVGESWFSVKADWVSVLNECVVLALGNAKILVPMRSVQCISD